MYLTESEVEEIMAVVEKEFEGTVHDNIITVGVIDSLFSNLDKIPMSELEALINKYKV